MDTYIDMDNSEENFYASTLRAGIKGMINLEFDRLRLRFPKIEFQACLQLAMNNAAHTISKISTTAGLEISAELYKKEHEKK
jgi:hypothetical protein